MLCYGMKKQEDIRRTNKNNISHNTLQYLRSAPESLVVIGK